MISFRHLTGQSIGWRELGSSPPCSACLELLAWVAPGACWKEWSAWGAKKNPTSTRTPSTLTLVGERLEDDESSFEAALFKGPAESLGTLLAGAAEPLAAILWGLAEPLEAVLGGSAEPLSVSEEHLADSHGTRASADTVLDFPEEARAPVDTDPGSPEERTLDSVVLSGRSEKEKRKERKKKKKKKEEEKKEG